MEVSLSVALILLVAVPLALVLWRCTPAQLADFASSQFFPLVVVLFLFTVLMSVNVAKAQDWTADVATVLVGALVGGVTYGATMTITGDRNKVAGRDLNERVENLQSAVSHIENAVMATVGENRQFLVLFFRGGAVAQESPGMASEYPGIASAVQNYVEEGWAVLHFTTYPNPSDGVVVTLSRKHAYGPIFALRSL